MPFSIVSALTLHPDRRSGDSAPQIVRPGAGEAVDPGSQRGGRGQAGIVAVNAHRGVFDFVCKIKVKLSYAS